MPNYLWILLVLAFALIPPGYLLLGRMLEARRKAYIETARATFRRNRERLEAKFFDLAASSGKPRGLNWTSCDFGNDVTLARDFATGNLSAFVAVSISFEAIEGGGMEDVEAVGNVRAATAVFEYRNGQWSSRGRAIMNLEPEEAVERFSQTLELISD